MTVLPASWPIFHRRLFGKAGGEISWSNDTRKFRLADFGGGFHHLLRIREGEDINAVVVGYFCYPAGRQGLAGFSYHVIGGRGLAVPGIKLDGAFGDNAMPAVGSGPSS